jgi:ketosteroid isomerase-like protein
MRYIILFTILLAATTGLAFGQCNDADKKALEAFDRAWGTAGETGDKAALMNIYADDYVGLPGMQNKTATIAGTMAAFERNKANPAGAEKISHDSYMITCTANTATIVHRNIVWTPNGMGGKPETLWTRSVHFLEKRAGKWQVVSNAGHPMTDEMILGYLEHDWNDAVIKKDKSWFDKYYAADFTSVGSKDGKLRDKAEDIATLNDPGGDEWAELSELDVRIEGRTAIVTGVNHVKGKDDKGVPYDVRSRFTDTWIKRDGRWQAWATQGTRLP